MSSRAALDAPTTRFPVSKGVAAREEVAVAPSRPLASRSELLFQEMLPPLEQPFAQRVARQEAYLEALRNGAQSEPDPSRHGIRHGCEVDLTKLDPEVPVIIVGDLHGDLANARSILLSNGNLEKIVDQKAVLVLLGDLVHPERGDLAQMDDSIRMRELIMNLTIAAPRNVFSLVGNHDPINELGIYKCSRGGEEVHQTLAYRSKLEDLLFAGGSPDFIGVFDYFDTYAKCTQASPYYVVGAGFAATHAGPVASLTRDEFRAVQPVDDCDLIGKIQDGKPEAWSDQGVAYVESTWSRWDPTMKRQYSYNADQVELFLDAYDQKGGHLFTGHTPPKDPSQWRSELMRRGVDGHEASHTVMVAARQNRIGYAVWQHGDVRFVDL